MKTKEVIINKYGKLFHVEPVPKIQGVYTVEINDGILEMVGGYDSKKFENYLKKSFRHFYNLDKNLETNKRDSRLKINPPKK